MTLYVVGFILGLWSLIVAFIRMLCIMARAGDMQSRASYEWRRNQSKTREL